MASVNSAGEARKAVIATHNAHKVEEISRILSPLGFDFVSLEECGDYTEPVEDADDFEGNARIKAKAAVENTGLPALADDSGLVVDALGGAPGVFSARYASEDGQDADDAANREKLLRELKNVPDEERTARFVCALVFVDTDGSEIVAQGTCEGKIGYEGRGENGFGYDPLFLADEAHGMTTAEIDPAEKDAISHRGAALRAFVKAFNERK